MEKFLTVYAKKREPQSYSTVRSPLEVCRRHVRDDGTLLRDVLFHKVLTADIEAFLGRYHNPDTRESYRLAISAAYTWSISKEEEEAEAEERHPRWTRDPASRVKAAKKPNRTTIPTDEQVRALLSVAKPYQDRRRTSDRRFTSGCAPES